MPERKYEGGHGAMRKSLEDYKILREEKLTGSNYGKNQIIPPGTAEATMRKYLATREKKLQDAADEKLHRRPGNGNTREHRRIERTRAEK